MLLTVHFASLAPQSKVQRAQILTADVQFSSMLLGAAEGPLGLWSGAVPTKRALAYKPKPSKHCFKLSKL